MYYLLRILKRLGLWPLSVSMGGIGTVTAVAAVLLDAQKWLFVALVAPLMVAIGLGTFSLLRGWSLPPLGDPVPQLTRWWLLALIHVRSAWRISVGLALAYVFLLMVFPSSIPTSNMSPMARLIHAPKAWLFAAFLVMAVCAFGANRCVPRGARVFVVAMCAFIGVLVVGARNDLGDTWTLLCGPLMAIAVGGVGYEVWLGSFPVRTFRIPIRGIYAHRNGPPRSI